MRALVCMCESLCGFDSFDLHGKQQQPEKLKYNKFENDVSYIYN